VASRLVVVDSHTLHRVGLAHAVGRQPDLEIVGAAGTVADALAVVPRLNPDVVTVDLLLPDGDGLSLARLLSAADPAPGIVVLSSVDGDDVLFQAMDARVSAFVAKSAGEEEILAAIRHAAVAPSSFTAAGLADALARLRTTRERSTLSQRELDVLRELHRGRSVPDVARVLYMSTSTAKTYVARIYDKLGAANRTQAFLTAMDLGLLPRQAVGDRKAG
jgi:DNA-binding NarL/FixJ family response regulator